MPEFSLQLRLTQKLALSPQLQQAIRLLQLTRLELRDYIQETVDANPLLEREETGDAQAGDTSIAEPASETAQAREACVRPGLEFAIGCVACAVVPAVAFRQSGRLVSAQQERLLRYQLLGSLPNVLTHRLDRALWCWECADLHQVVPLRNPFGWAHVRRPALQCAAVGGVTVVLLQAPLELGVQRIAVLVLRSGSRRAEINTYVRWSWAPGLPGLRRRGLRMSFGVGGRT